MSTIGTYIHADVLNSHTGYDVTSLNTSGWQLSKFKKRVENAASDGFGWNFSRKVYARMAKFHTIVLSGITGPTNLPDMPSLASFFLSAAKCN